MSNLQTNSLVNQDTFLAEAIPDSIEFGGFSLSSLCGAETGVMIQRANFFDLTNIDVAQFVAEQIDGGGILQKKYGNKTISLSLVVQGSDYDDLVRQIDTLKKSTQGVDQELNIKLLGEVRSYTATVSSLRIPSFGKNDDSVDDVALDMIITDPHWKVKAPVSEFLPSVTGDFEKVINNLGTIETYPVVYVLCQSSGNAITALDIELKAVGDVSGFTVGITTAVTNGDVLIFDYDAKTITKNGTELAFSGVMTPMGLGYSVFGFDFTGTVNASVYITYQKKYV